MAYPLPFVSRSSHSLLAQMPAHSCVFALIPIEVVKEGEDGDAQRDAITVPPVAGLDGVEGEASPFRTYDAHDEPVADAHLALLDFFSPQPIAGSSGCGSSRRGLGGRRCALQTETVSIVITPFPGAVPTKPGGATLPFFGHEPAILDPISGETAVLHVLTSVAFACLIILPSSLFLLSPFLPPSSSLPLCNSIEGILALKTPWPLVARTM
ncbi:Acetyl-coenzyme A synthetase [Mycena venus]|uniref:Acetyl-coenzyme A synthetase n=1 Tax=Mycena venus TaxID=2733690 RepID=A0A8H7CP59_9AGAR|nr:Acetyl-coenzyme A synthetase [Mycena venus]